MTASNVFNGHSIHFNGKIWVYTDNGDPISTTTRDKGPLASASNFIVDCTETVTVMKPLCQGPTALIHGNMVTP